MNDIDPQAWLADVLARLRGYEARRVTIDGCEFREGLNAVGIRGGVAGNVIPDECQSMPITAPNDWNQKGCANRRRSSSRP